MLKVVKKTIYKELKDTAGIMSQIQNINYEIEIKESKSTIKYKKILYGFNTNLSKQKRKISKLENRFIGIIHCEDKNSRKKQEK